MAPLGRHGALRAELMLELEETTVESGEPQRVSSRALFAWVDGSADGIIV